MPGVNVDVLKVATPPVNVPVPSVLPPSRKVTVPVGVPAPGAAALSVAVNVTDAFSNEGFCEDVTADVTSA